MTNFDSKHVSTEWNNEIPLRMLESQKIRQMKKLKFIWLKKLLTRFKGK